MEGKGDPVPLGSSVNSVASALPREPKSGPLQCPSHFSSGDPGEPLAHRSGLHDKLQAYFHSPVLDLNPG